VILELVGMAQMTAKRIDSEDQMRVKIKRPRGP
jgi:hypothetical protein